MSKITHEKFILSLIKENFLKLEILEDQEIGPDEIHAIAAGYNELVGDNEYVVAIYGYDFATFTRDAMEVAIEHYSDPNRKRVAVISNNLAHMLLVRLYIIWYKPTSQMRLFKSEEAAYNWLEESLNPAFS